VSNFVEHLFEGLVKEIASLVVTTIWGGVTSLFLGGWAWLLTRNPDMLSNSLEKPRPGHTTEALADQILLAWSWLLGVSFAFSLLWLYLVRLHRPTSPLQAVKFRKYWLAIAALLLGCTVAFHSLALNVPMLSERFPQFTELSDSSKLLLLVGLVVCALAFLYVLSVLRSPPTVIAAVPLGSYVARVRWR